MRKNILITLMVAGVAMTLYRCGAPRKSADPGKESIQKQLPRDSAGRIIVRTNPDGAYLSPEESLASIYLPKGYRLQLVASEPMIKEPVAIAWDGNGRMFVTEMRTYMQDVDGTDENAPVSRVSLLEDTDGDGTMDKSTVYIDSLLLPRMILCVGRKLLVSETYTNNIWAYEDRNNDGVADHKTQVFGNSTPHTGNLEHQRSGFIWNIDNRIYTTYENLRYRYVNGKLAADTMFTGSGQWGLGNDDYGRLYFSSAGGETPAYGFQINPFYGKYDVKEQLDGDFNAVWPVIATPDVQGGPGRLRPDSTLNHFTGCCGQSVYRGNALPEDLKGDLVICEPVGRLIRRAKVAERNGIRVLRNAYDREEFIVSTDMNFRPVNTANGPDGCLYIVDMHRGIIQEGNWTRKGSYLRPEILKRALDKNIGHGRIYRLVYDGFKPGARPDLLDRSSNELTQLLTHNDGWWRDNAQKELIVRGDKSVIPALQTLLRTHPRELARLHALWTLDGLDAADTSIVGAALRDASPQLRKAAVIISERYLRNGDGLLFQRLANLADPDADVQMQLAATLSLYGTSGAKAYLAKLSPAENSRHLKEVAALVERNKNQKTYGMDVSNLPVADRAVVLRGRQTFQQVCATCHGDNGKGVSIGGAPMAAPPLANSKRAANRDALVAVLLHGLTGPIDGKTYPDVMAPLGVANSDAWVADVLSYVHYRFRPSGSGFAMISPDDVKKIRAATEGRSSMFTLPELDTFNVPATIAGKKAVAAAKPAVKPAAPVKAKEDKQRLFAAERKLLAGLDCHACHQPATKLVGPSYKDIALKYKRTESNIGKLAAKVISGGSGVWGATPMTPHPALAAADAKKIVNYILSL
ncbi:DUF7133 domain-containing protein [Chitinophaga rhizosphaerae]|uniref:DUF7133 domain-containing protein n=1 Tax=Chitinophaga rhizosphaerae TaxID=1864947 RepID=UPI0013DFD1E8|nr:c-type cytochrome [Chitinophaga rhizosphaerae]